MIGSLTAIGNIVYVAEFDGTSTTGYSMKTGRPVFRYPRGTYTPVVSDGRRLYLIGYSSITALQPYRYSAAVSKAIEAPVVKVRPKAAKPRSGHKASVRHPTSEAARLRQRWSRTAEVAPYLAPMPPGGSGGGSGWAGAKWGKRREWIIRSRTERLAG